MLRNASSRRRWFGANAVVGLWPANSDGDDIVVYADEARAPVATLHTLRQQLGAPRGPRQSSRSPTSSRRGASDVADYVGAFTVTAGIGEDEQSPNVSSAPTTTTPPSSSRRSPTAWPKPSPNACTTRATRALGVRARRALAPRGNSSPRNTTASDQRPGYPAQPDHTEKQTLFELLDARAHTA